MQQRATSLLLLLAIVMTIGSIALYRFIPQERLQIMPNTQWSFDLTDAYEEGQITGNYWKNKEQAHFICDTPDAANFKYTCTLNISLSNSFTEGIDLSRYNQLIIKARYSGDNPKVRVFIRNYNSAYSSSNDYNSSKFMQLTLNTSELTTGEPVVIKLNEFSIADWWLYQRELERKNMPLEFTNVNIMGFDFSPYLENATYMDLAIDSIYFEGPQIKEKNWYLGILIAWLTLAVIFLAVQFINLLRSNQVYTEQIDQLASDKDHFEKQTQKYKELSHLDSLTGVLNRLGLEKNLEQLYLNSENRPISLIVLDIDHFKRVNDRRGHDAGDEILKEIAQIIQSNIRENDLFARWGGEEFVLIAPASNTEIAHLLAEKLRTVIARSPLQPKQPLAITCSLGVTMMQADEPFEVAFKRADIALYKAKNQGRNCTVINDGQNLLSDSNNTKT